MANHALPTTSSLYTDVLTNLKDRIDDSLKMLDSVNTSPTNVPTNAVRWNSTTKLWEKYNGSTWDSLAASYAIQVLKSSNLVGGNSTTLLGSIPYQSNTDTTTLLAPNTTTTRKFLRQTGTGTDGAIPVWDTLLAADIPVLDTSKITTGTLPVSRGGTGVTTSTGTGSVVLSESPTFTGTVTAPTFSGALTGNATTATTATTATNQSGGSVNATTGRFANDIIASQSITIGTGGNYSEGSIYSDPNWGMIFRAKQSSPSVAQFAWANSSGDELFRFNGTALTTDITGNSGTSTALVGDERNWAAYRSRSVANMLGWNHYGNGHCIIDASSGIAPNGAAIDNTNALAPWTPSFPTLMGWNGVNTHGVRVDSARVASAFTTAVGSAPSYACRAWVNFIGGTVAVRASGNVSSITHHGTGDYTVNFIEAMPDVGYAPVGNIGDSLVTPSNYTSISSRFNSFTVSSVRVSQSAGNSVRGDSLYNMVAIFR